MKAFRIIAVLILLSIIMLNCHSGKHNKQPSKHKDTAKSQMADMKGMNLKKYVLKSGIVTFETIIAGTKGKKMLYFDDYGKQEKEVFYDGNTMKDAIVTVGDKLYKLIYKDKEAYYQGQSTRGCAYKFDWNEVPDSQKKNGYAIKLENTTIAGKLCEAYKIDNSEVITEFAGWGGICLYARQTSNAGEAITKATMIAENVNIPENCFEIPGGFKIKD